MLKSLRVFYLVPAFISCLFISWILLASQDFFYSGIYEIDGFAAHMHKYAPQNRFKADFAFTDAHEHKRLFAEINYAVHLAPQQLEQIRYHSADGVIEGQLLHFREIQHLQDVAHFIQGLYSAGIVSLLLLSVCIVLMRRYRLKPATGRLMLLTGAGLAGLMATLLVVFGPTRMFYFLHTQIFPKDHAWFFYYQDSLMSTLMKAPDLFAYIALELLVLGILLFIALHLSLKRFLTARH